MFCEAFLSLGMLYMIEGFSDTYENLTPPPPARVRFVEMPNPYGMVELGCERNGYTLSLEHQSSLATNEDTGRTFVKFEKKFKFNRID